MSPYNTIQFYINYRTSAYHSYINYRITQYGLLDQPLVRQWNDFQWWSANQDGIYKVALEFHMAENHCSNMGTARNEFLGKIKEFGEFALNLVIFSYSFRLL